MTKEDELLEFPPLTLLLLVAACAIAWLVGLVTGRETR